MFVNFKMKNMIFTNDTALFRCQWRKFGTREGSVIGEGLPFAES